MLVQVRPARLAGVVVLRPEPRHDERGFFVRTLDTAALAAAGLPTAYPQENQSRSVRGTLRGLHVRGGAGEAKLVRCARGAVHDVLVDVRPGSPTFGVSESLRLDDVVHDHVFVPRGVAHGFQVLSDVADVCYHHEMPYDRDADRAIAWDDPELGIDWPLPPAALSARDRDAPRLADLAAELRDWFGAAGEP